jgi:hypothetical protein
VQEVVEMAINSPAGLQQVQVTALFSLGNMANHAAMVAEMRRLQIEQPIAQLLQSRCPGIVKNAQRLFLKLQVSHKDAREGPPGRNGSQPAGHPQMGHGAGGGVEAASQGVSRMGLRDVPVGGTMR